MSLTKRDLVETVYGANLHKIPEALEGVFVSGHERSYQGDPANVVDGLFAIARAINRVADAIDAFGPTTTEEDGSGV